MNATVKFKTVKSKPEVLLAVRPRRIAVYAGVAATAVIVTMVVIGLLLRDADLGVTFQVSDQIGLIGVGVIIGGAILMMARPRLRVTEDGMWVRNVFGERFFEWKLVLKIAFPEGANWAQITLPDEESHPLMAIQSLDKMRAVEALRKARALHERYAPARPARVARPAAPVEVPERPLGRLERIDQEIAAAKAAREAAKAKS